jgi:hypothetical protein
VEEGSFNSGSPHYAPGSGEAIAWFSFHEPQSIGEIRAAATSTDGWGDVFAEASIRQTIVWRAGAALPAQADWVQPLMKAPKNIVVEPPSDSVHACGVIASGSSRTVHAQADFQRRSYLPLRYRHPALRLHKHYLSS